MSTLYICEKPSQARDIASVLGVAERCEGYLQNSHTDTRVTWCLGHLLELAPPEHYCETLKPWRMEVLPVIPDTWAVIPKQKTQKQLNILKRLLKTTSKVVVATDADREGDVIGREVLEYCGYKGTIERLWLSALDEASIKKALNNIKPGKATESLYQAGLGRQRADWLIGMNMTMATSSLFGVRGQGVLSVGRVQTPTLNLIVQRDNEIENFKSKDYYQLLVRFKGGSGEFLAAWHAPDDYTDTEGRCLDKSFMDKISLKVENKKGVIREFEQNERKTSPPVCFSLSNLQKLASSQFGFSAKKTLEVAQSLYEKHKATTYPRTDSGYLPEDQFYEAEQILSHLANIHPELKGLIEKSDYTFRSPAWNNKKVTAHHGIIPTLNKHVSIKNMSKDEANIYELVCRYYIAQFMGNYEYSQRKVNVECEGEKFSSSCQTPKVLGWKEALGKSIEDPEESSAEEYPIPMLSNQEPVQSIENTVLSKQTKPPVRYTEGTLISAMKNAAKFVEDIEQKKTLKETSGIGTEATRANIIEIIINRGFVERKKKQLVSTDKGRNLIKLMPENITNPATTAMWEQSLEEIADGNVLLKDFLLDQEDVLDFMLEDLQELKSKQPPNTQPKHTCPACQSALVRRKGKKGFWWGCSGYPACKTTLLDQNGAPGGHSVAAGTG